MKWILNRFKEQSTWKGIMLLATAFGVHMEPEKWDAIITLGLGLAGVIGVFWPDPKKAVVISTIEDGVEVRKAIPVVNAKSAALNPNRKG